MSQKESMDEEESETNTSWTVNVEPEVQIQEADPNLEIIQVEHDPVGQLSSESEDENSFQAVQEYESVLVDKICEVCGNPFQAFELVNPGADKKPQLTTCEMCSYYIKPHSMEIENQETAGDGLTCNVCSKTFSTKDKLERHRVIHSELRPFCCKLCVKTFKRNDKLTEHIRIVHSTNGEILQGTNGEIEKCTQVVCDVCGDIEGVITVSIGELVTSLVNLCEVCNLSRREKMTDPTKIDSTKLFQCDLCSRYFTRKDHATRHRLSHLDVKPYECYICEKSFNRNDRLLRHMKTHPDAKPFSCKFCFQAFSERSELKTHLTTHPSPPSKPHICDICNKAFRDNDKLTRHMTTHSDYKPFCCELCGKTFKLQETLLSHQQIHSNWKPFKCETCGMAFRLRDTYRRHLLVHSNVTLFSCNVCSKSFKRSDKLKAHHSVHEEVRPYPCELCKSAFKRRDKYVRHLRQVHHLPADVAITRVTEPQVELKMACDMCDKTFSCEDDLAEHKMVHYR